MNDKGIKSFITEYCEPLCQPIRQLRWIEHISKKRYKLLKLFSRKNIVIQS